MGDTDDSWAYDGFRHVGAPPRPHEHACPPNTVILRSSPYPATVEQTPLPPPPPRLCRQLKWNNECAGYAKESGVWARGATHPCQCPTLPAPPGFPRLGRACLWCARAEHAQAELHHTRLPIAACGACQRVHAARSGGNGPNPHAPMWLVCAVAGTRQRRGLPAGPAPRERRHLLHAGRHVLLLMPASRKPPPSLRPQRAAEAGRRGLSLCTLSSLMQHCFVFTHNTL